MPEGPVSWDMQALRVGVQLPLSRAAGNTPKSSWFIYPYFTPLDGHPGQISGEAL